MKTNIAFLALLGSFATTLAFADDNISVTVNGRTYSCSSSAAQAPCYNNGSIVGGDKVCEGQSVGLACNNHGARGACVIDRMYAGEPLCKCL